MSDQSVADLLDEVSLRAGWEVRTEEEDHLVIDYRAVPQDRLNRKAYPGMDITHAGSIWMVLSHDMIGDGFDREHAGIVNHGPTVDCTNFDDAVALVEHGMEKVEKAVGKDLREGHERTLLADGGTEPTDPRAPNWFEFNKVNDLPNDWSFEVLDWDDDPDEDEVVDRGEAEVVRGDHRFVINTWLVPRTNTHDRYWSVAYETVNQDGEDEVLSFYISNSAAIVRNNLGYARDSVDEEDESPHVLVRNHSDGPRETFEFPTEYMAESAADLQTRLKMDGEDRDYIVFIEEKSDWEDTLERERQLEEADHAR